MTLQIVVDTREPKDLYESYKKEFPDISFIYEKINDGDYLAKTTIHEELLLVERKTINDFYLSFMSKKKQANSHTRIANETDKLATHENTLVLFLMIGSITKWVKNMEFLQINPDIDKLYGEIASLMTREKFHFIWAIDEFEARIMMVRFARAIYEGKYEYPARRNPVKLMARLLRITPVQYIELRQKFGSIQNISLTSSLNLQSVRGIGPSKADFILEQLRS